MGHNVFEKNARQSGMVRIRGGFSDTNGIVTFNTVLQVEEFDNTTRILMYNKLYSMIEVVIKHPGEFWYYPYPDIISLKHSFCKSTLGDVFCERNQPDSFIGYSFNNVLERLEDVVNNATYNEVLDVLEYCCRWFSTEVSLNKNVFYDGFNILFEDEYIGYRFIDGKLTAITDNNEIEAINNACTNPYDGCRQQLKKAVGFLSDRVNKDYKNCIKESISAVESICQQIVGNDKATLVEALRKLEDSGVVIHPALKNGFIKLYGYTSDQGGIRHAEGMFESNVTFEEAKYMLVSCSAFVNYLIAVSGKGSN